MADISGFKGIKSTGYVNDRSNPLNVSVIRNAEAGDGIAEVICAIGGIAPGNGISATVITVCRTTENIRRCFPKSGEDQAVLHRISRKVCSPINPVGNLKTVSVA